MSVHLISRILPGRLVLHCRYFMPFIGAEGHNFLWTCNHEYSNGLYCSNVMHSELLIWQWAETLWHCCFFYMWRFWPPRNILIFTLKISRFWSLILIYIYRDSKMYRVYLFLMFLVPQYVCYIFAFKITFSQDLHLCIV